ncbi:membrane-associated transporter protein-like [Limulus polyphemus]|uniref:Membrane-associated transporter protein-like n=1 Tax=Limulus polyphemus TaxID=6850 RepID=A0ABM1B5Q1_LIMPO|nr:membrane-associated transporter protein-like [Limulus polyphemus]
MNINAVYVEGVAAFKTLQTRTKNSFQLLKESSLSQRVANIQTRAQHTFDVLKSNTITRLNRGSLSDDYSHIYRRKTRWELVILSGAVCGIEFCYAAETAFVSPILLGLGVQVRFMTLIWCLSPLIGFFLTPILGSLSDRCYSRLGRRRPFIIFLSIGIFLGLIFVPNGKDIGLYLGDHDEILYEDIQNITSTGYIARDNLIESMDVPNMIPESSPNSIVSTDLITKVSRKLEMVATRQTMNRTATILEVLLILDIVRTFTIKVATVTHRSLKLGAKPVYIGGQLAYSIGMIVMASVKHKLCVILLSPTAGMMYATLFTMPYLLVAHYHCNETFEKKTEGSQLTSSHVRGIGTDVATVGSMVFLSQFVLSSCMGSIVQAVGSSVATVWAASILSSCGALCATQVMYLDL